MDDVLFIVRDSNGNSLAVTEKPVRDSLFGDAHDLMDVTRKYKPHDIVECCELWVHDNPHTMKLLGTVF